MAKKNGTPKSRGRKEKHPCGCFFCIGYDREEIDNKKYQINTKYPKKILE